MDCRLCLVESSEINLQSAFEVKNGIKIADVVEKICLISIDEEDKLQTICWWEKSLNKIKFLLKNNLQQLH